MDTQALSFWHISLALLLPLAISWWAESSSRLAFLEGVLARQAHARGAHAAAADTGSSARSAHAQGDMAQKSRHAVRSDGWGLVALAVCMLELLWLLWP
jgi:hypothetical protein